MSCYMCTHLSGYYYDDELQTEIGHCYRNKENKWLCSEDYEKGCDKWEMDERYWRD